MVSVIMDLETRPRFHGNARYSTMLVIGLSTVMLTVIVVATPFLDAVQGNFLFDLYFRLWETPVGRNETLVGPTRLFPLLVVLSNGDYF